MVYCGKASQGCQSCRTRRIKCDKVRPQCSQCIRVSKTCPGYRDQLSLMFRDESTKVIQKAHAQWGVSELETGESSGSSPTSASPSGSTSSGSSSSSSSSSSTRSQTWVSESPRSKASTPLDGGALVMTQAPNEIFATKADGGIRFFLERYIVGHPDEPKASQDLQSIRWIHMPESQPIMAALGLASLANLTGDRELHIEARQKYGLALQSLAASIQNIQGMDLEVSIRSAVMLAIFEVIRGNVEPNATRTHIMGSAALLRSFLPKPGSPQVPGALRALLQLCFSMLVPCLVAGITLPDLFFHFVGLGDRMAPASDKPSAELIGIIARYVQLSAFMHSHALTDGRPKVAEVIQEILGLDAEFDTWERRQDGIWPFTEERGEDGFFPADGVLEGCYHVYTDMWTARVWNHYRWSRIMVNQMLLECVERFPASSLSLISAGQQEKSMDVMARLARDTLVSVPTHYRHPRLERYHRDRFDKTKGGAGMGAAGIPTLLFQIRVAGCAPSIPKHQWSWARDILQTIWADTGMMPAKTHAEFVSKARQRDPAEAATRVVLESSGGRDSVAPAYTHANMLWYG
ncbi:hypothetical protein B0T17DRAFT_494130 [Bombardia bombarda]|uniref:Zn(2)-C6 fungal-type domain-containing protein n=1 Tax=Bombardia bombarda TaxID=252184 RepID=A0AA39WU08_9PEZI|nr:hypothetical protein B0T17DRAFT_494130 [Bombardia bombarda]